MIQAERACEKPVDMNYCYKIVLAGTNEGCPEGKILEAIWEYTGIPIRQYDRQGNLNACAGPDRTTQENALKVEKELPDGQGSIAAYVTPENSRKTAEELVEILVQSYSMRKQFTQGEKYGHPDYLWQLNETRI